MFIIMDQLWAAPKNVIFVPRVPARMMESVQTDGAHTYVIVVADGPVRIVLSRQEEYSGSIEALN